MSGGVDSSVATALAVEAGHEVVGATLKQWEFPDEETRLSKGCTVLDAVADARRVADVLGIPHYTFDFRELFAREVVEPFVDDYARGLTPNPCVRCNELVRFGALADKAEMLGFDGIVTGHYARIARRTALPRAQPRQGPELRPVRDRTSRRRARALPARRRSRARTTSATMARDLGFSNADREDSLEVCFVGEGKRPGDVVAERVPVAVRSGPIVDGERQRRRRAPRARVLHDRAAQGSRRRTASAATSPRSTPSATCSSSDDADDLGSDGARRDACPVLRRATGRRHDGSARSSAIAGAETPRVFTSAQTDGFALAFERSVRAVSPGQAVVLYDGDEVIGGGTIAPRARSTRSSRAAGSSSALAPRSRSSARASRSAWRGCAADPMPGDSSMLRGQGGVYAHDLATGRDAARRDAPGRLRCGDPEPGRQWVAYATGHRRGVAPELGGDQRFQVAEQLHDAARLDAGRTARRRRALVRRRSRRRRSRTAGARCCSPAVTPRDAARVARRKRVRDRDIRRRGVRHRRRRQADGAVADRRDAARRVAGRRRAALVARRRA